MKYLALTLALLTSCSSVPQKYYENIHKMELGRIASIKYLPLGRPSTTHTYEVVIYCDHGKEYIISGNEPYKKHFWMKFKENDLVKIYYKEVYEVDRKNKTIRIVDDHEFIYAETQE